MTPQEPEKVAKKKKEESSTGESEYEAMLDLVEFNHYQWDKTLIKSYKKVKALPEGPKRKEAYLEFQKLAKKLKMVETKNKKKYLQSMKDLEMILRDKT
jgi:hypothetical protein